MDPDLSGIPTPIPLWFWGITAFLISACVGSFLNVVAARIPRGQSIVWPGSHCFTCGAPIRAQHNIPVLSWFILKGRCHDCRASFSVRYALVELFFAVLCTCTILQQGGPTHHAISLCVLYGFLFPLACIDLDTWTLPDCITIPGIVVGIMLAVPLGLDAVIDRALAAAIGYGLLRGGSFIGSKILDKEAMGGGDFMLYALICAFLGTKCMLMVVFLSSLQGSVLGIAMIASRKLTERRRRRLSFEMETAEDGDRSQQESDAEAGGDVQGEASASLRNETASEADASNDGKDGDAAADDYSTIPVEKIEGELPADIAAILGRKPGSALSDEAIRFSCKIPEDGWTPDPHSLPFGPMLALAAVEYALYPQLGRLLFHLG